MMRGGGLRPRRASEDGGIYGSSVGRGLAPSVTSTVRVCPLGSTTWTKTPVPGFKPPSADPRASLSLIDVPFTLTMTSPLVRPAFAAGLSGGVATT